MQGPPGAQGQEELEGAGDAVQVTLEVLGVGVGSSAPLALQADPPICFSGGAEAPPRSSPRYQGLVDTVFIY